MNMWCNIVFETAMQIQFITNECRIYVLLKDMFVEFNKVSKSTLTVLK